MADLFNSNIGTASGVSAGIPGGGLSAPTSVGGVIGDDFSAQQARINDLTATNKAKIAAEHQNEIAKSTPKVDQNAVEEEKLQKLAVNIQQAYQSIDSQASNPVEANQKKRQIRSAALIQAGKSGSPYISSFLDSLETKREVRPDGMVNILGSKGEVLGVEGGDSRSIIAHRQEQQINKVHEVFPNAIDTVTALGQLNTANGGIGLSEGSKQEVLSTLKNAASSFKGISEDYHIQAQTMDAAGATKLAENAQRAYMGNISNMMGVFMTPDIMNSIKSGSLNRSQVTLAAQQMRRDIVDEITTQHIPVSIQTIDAYIKTTMDDMNAAYTDIQSNDLVSLDIAKKTLDAKSSIRQLQIEQKLDIPAVRAAAPLVDMVSKLSAAQESATQAAANLQFSTEPGAKVQQQGLLNQVQAYSQMGRGLEPAVRNISQSFVESNFKFADLDSKITDISDSKSLDVALTAIGDITNTPNGWVHQPAVTKTVDTLIKKIDPLLKEGTITKEKYDSIFSQLAAYNTHAISQLNVAGYTVDKYNQDYFINRNALK